MSTQETVARRRRAIRRGGGAFQAAPGTMTPERARWYDDVVVTLDQHIADEAGDAEHLPAILRRYGFTALAELLDP